MRPGADIADERQGTAPNLLASRHRSQFFAVTLIRVDAGFDRTRTRHTDKSFHRGKFAFLRDLIVLFPTIRCLEARGDAGLIERSAGPTPRRYTRTDFHALFRRVLLMERRMPGGLQDVVENQVDRRDQPTLRI